MVRFLSRKQVFHVLSAAISTLALALTLLALEHAHLFDWMDPLALSVASRLDEQKDKSAESVLSPTRVWKIRINEVAFAELFSEKSPLDPKLLFEVSKRVLQAKPAVLAIDIDVSPEYSKQATLSQAVELRDLDKLLIEAVRTHGIPVVLAQAPPSLPRETIVMRWMSAMCAHGIRFASPQLVSHLGAVTKFRDSKETFARVVFDEFEKKGSSSNEACELLGKSATAHAYFKRLGALQVAKNTKTSPLNFKSLDGGNSSSTVLAKADASLTLEPEPPSGVIALVGGSFPQQDQHLTPHGERSGMAIHAAAINTLAQPIRTWKTYQVLVLEIVLGTCIGLLFHEAWKAQDKFSKRFSVYWDPRRSIKTFQTKVSASIWLLRAIFARCLAVASLTMVLLLPFLFTLCALVVLGVILENETWFNPGPLIFGLFLHSVLVRVESLHEHHERLHSPISTSKFLTKHIDAFVIMGAALVMLAIQALF